MKQDMNINTLTPKSQNKTSPQTAKRPHIYTQVRHQYQNNPKYPQLYTKHIQGITANSAQQILNFTSKGSPTQVQS